MLHPASGWWFIGSSKMLYMLVLVTHRLLLLLLHVVHWKNEMLIHNWPFCPSWWPCSMLLSMWLALSTATTTIITTTITTMIIITTTTTWIWTQSWVPEKDPCTYLLTWIILLDLLNHIHSTYYTEFKTKFPSQTITTLYGPNHVHFKWF